MDLLRLSFSLGVSCSRFTSRLVSLNRVLLYLANLSSMLVRCSNPEKQFDSDTVEEEKPFD